MCFGFIVDERYCITFIIVYALLLMHHPYWLVILVVLLLLASELKAFQPFTTVVPVQVSPHHHRSLVLHRQHVFPLHASMPSTSALDGHHNGLYEPEQGALIFPIAQAVIQSLQSACFQRLHFKQNIHLLSKDLKLAVDRFHVRAIDEIVLSLPNRKSHSDGKQGMYSLEVHYRYLTHDQVKYWSFSNIQDLQQLVQGLLEEVAFKKVMLTTVAQAIDGQSMSHQKAVQEFVIKRNPLPSSHLTQPNESKQKYAIVGVKSKTAQFLPISSSSIKPTPSTAKNSPISLVTPSTSSTKDGRISVDEPFLAMLNITTSIAEKTSKGDQIRCKADKKDKFKQINKFIEILHHLVVKVLSQEQNKDCRHIEIEDMGCGKGYLTFAAHVYFSRLLASQGYQVKTTGIELQPHLVRQTNEIVSQLLKQDEATSSMYNHISFLQGNITEYALNPDKFEEKDQKQRLKVKKVKILIALHACDTLTDEAIYRGVQQQFDLIIASPCCHKQIRRQIELQSSNLTSSSSHNLMLRELLGYGIYRERLSEMLTDTLRAKVLQACGYQSQIMEYISQEATAKNSMITAVRKPSVVNLDSINLQEVKQMMSEYALTSHRLFDLVADCAEESSHVNTSAVKEIERVTNKQMLPRLSPLKKLRKSP